MAGDFFRDPLDALLKLNLAFKKRSQNIPKSFNTISSLRHLARYGFLRRQLPMRTENLSFDIHGCTAVVTNGYGERAYLPLDALRRESGKFRHNLCLGEGIHHLREFPVELLDTGLQFRELLAIREFPRRAVCLE